MTGNTVDEQRLQFAHDERSCIFLIAFVYIAAVFGNPFSRNRSFHIGDCMDIVSAGTALVGSSPFLSRVIIMPVFPSSAATTASCPTWNASLISVREARWVAARCRVENSTARVLSPVSAATLLARVAAQPESCLCPNASTKSEALPSSHTKRPSARAIPSKLRLQRRIWLLPDALPSP